jgi:AraC family transcriptional activator of pobA
MDKSESIKEFYHRKFDWMPDNIRNEIGHFNVFPLAPFVGDKAKPVPYKRRDCYKIMLKVLRKPLISIISSKNIHR